MTNLLLNKIEIPIGWYDNYNSNKIKKELFFSIIPQNHIWKCYNCNKTITPYNIMCRSCSLKGRHLSKNSEFKKGHINYFKNHSEEFKKRMIGKGNPAWKGENIRYNTVHNWVRRHKLKPEFCEDCNINKSQELANISGKYLRDVMDYKWLCKKCHYEFDKESFTGKENNIRIIKDDLLMCSKCKRMLTKENFYKNKNEKNGCTYKCKKCFNLKGDEKWI